MSKFEPVSNPLDEAIDLITLIQSCEDNIATKAAAAIDEAEVIALTELLQWRNAFRAGKKSTSPTKSLNPSPPPKYFGDVTTSSTEVKDVGVEDSGTTSVTDAKDAKDLGDGNVEDSRFYFYNGYRFPDSADDSDYGSAYRDVPIDI